MNGEPPPSEPAPPSAGDADADELVARAIESVLEAVPVSAEEPLPEALARYQPWADTAVPGGKNKRPLQALLDELAARVEAEPEARAATPQGRPPMQTYFDRFGTAPRDGEGRSRRARRRRRVRQGARGVEAPAAGQTDQPVVSIPSAPASPQPGATPAKSPEAGRRRRRRRPGRRSTSGDASS